MILLLFVYLILKLLIFISVIRPLGSRFNYLTPYFTD